MIKKISNILFIILFFVIISAPFLFANFSSGEASGQENRNLAGVPELIVDGKLNENFSTDTENWLMDNMGFREALIRCNASLQYDLFHRLDSQTYYLGQKGDLNYATPEMILDYAHANLRSEDEVKKISDSYQTISDYLNQHGSQFYYVQCYDKHSIYPEQFMDTINQFGGVSKTDQVITALQDHTTVNTISLKERLISAKEQVQTYSHWGDPTHWNDRGAYIGYQTIMEDVNAHNDGVFRILQESDFDIHMEDVAMTQNYRTYAEDIQEKFTLKNPTHVQKDASVMGKWSSDERHFVWKNDKVENDKKLLLMCDSYIASFTAEYFAQSFSEVWLIRADYTEDLAQIVEAYAPDIVIYECAERVDRSAAVCNLADALAS